MRAMKRAAAAVAAGSVMALTMASVAAASDVEVSSFVDADVPVTSVSIEAGETLTITVNLSVIGKQDGTATFEVDRSFALAENAFAASDPVTFTVAPRPVANAAAEQFSTAAVISVDEDQAPGTYLLSVQASDITNSNDRGAKLAVGDPATLEVVVTEPEVVLDTTPPVVTVPASVGATATGASQAVVSYEASAWDETDGAVPVSCSPASGTSFAVGATTVLCTATDAAGNIGSASFTVTVTYAWSGFLRPVDNLPVVNVAKAGSAIPVKFSLSGDQGLAIFDLAPGSRTAPTVGTATSDALEELATPGASGLTYDALTDTYTYVWKTDKAWSGTTRDVVLTLADGSVRTARFQFTK